jgi:acetyltransferase-like isoleucine patch superfamily enzyme
MPNAGLSIGNDVFIGHNAIILPTVEQIGDGAIIGAGSVVHKDVAPYAVVTGNPARVVRYRFSEKTIAQLLESRWWLRTIDELSSEIDSFQRPIEGKEIR